MKNLLIILEKLNEANEKAKTKEEKETMKKINKIFSDLGKTLDNI